MKLRAVAVGSLLLVSSGAKAFMVDLPPSLAPVILSESVPFTFTPNGYSAEDYRLEWDGPAIPGVEISIGAKSLDWVRVREILDIPRAVAVFSVKDAEKGQVSSAGFSQPLLKGESAWTARLPIALISGPENPVSVKVHRGGRELTGRLVVRLSPRPQNASQILYDSTCSHHRVKAESTGGRPDEFIYIGCRYIRTLGPDHPLPELELYVFWDGVGQKIQVNGVPTSASSVSVWALKLAPEPGVVDLQAGDHKVRVSYKITPRLRRLSVAAGVGPYGYVFQDGQKDVGQIIPLPTLYTSYFLSETMKGAAFTAVAVNKSWFVNQGLYLWSEQMRVFDSRFSMVLLFGLDILIFPHRGETHLRIGGPQGIEFGFRDFLARRHDVNFGAFMKPRLVTDQFYYNAWVRWGPPEWFVEFNYISWEEEVSSQRVHSRSMGITVGMPLFQAM